MQLENTFPRKSLCLVTCVAGLSGAASGQINLDEAVSIGVGADPTGIASADFNGDGFIDLATVAGGNEAIQIRLGDGNGGFTAGPSSLLQSSASPKDLVAGDLDGDNDIDIAIAMRDDPNGIVGIFLNQGNASFTPAGNVTVGERPQGMAIADRDNDGDLDIAVANRNSDSASVLTNNGSASFTVMTVPVPAEPRAVAFGNFGGNGELDLAVTNHDQRRVETYILTGSTFAPGVGTFVGPAVRPDGIDAADLNNDGLTDIVTAVSHFASPEDNRDELSVLINTGAGFSGPFNYDSGGTTTSEVIAVDLDCDGFMDLVASNTDSHNISILQNLGDGTFGEAVRMDTGVFPSRATADDFDGNGSPDVAVSNAGSADISLLMNQSCDDVVPCPWDISGDDGQINVTDLLAMLAAWGPAPGSPADINGDDTVNVVDLLELLGNWGTCP